MVFLHANFRDLRGAYTEAVIQRSLSKQTFLEKRQNSQEITGKEFPFCNVLASGLDNLVFELRYRNISRIFSNYKLGNLPCISL